MQKKSLLRVANPALAGSVAALWLIHRVVRYPPSYLFVPDREIWTVQAGTWMLFFVEAGALALAADWIVHSSRRALARVTFAEPLSRAALRVESVLQSRRAPLAVGILSLVLAGYAQGPLRSIATGPDEAAYLMQARLLADGHWTAPPAPIPEFFEQMYVFRSPFTAAKYPPGFPLALVPGIWIGAPFLVPILLVGITSGLVFSLARNLAGPWVASLTWILWIANPHGEAPLQRFMSEHLSTMLVVASWWALNRWRKRDHPGDLLLLAFFVGWGAITRPLTMFAVAIPIAVVVIRRIAKTGRWKPLASTVAVGAAILLVLPLWNRETTGDWKVSPLVLHVRWYTPYDALGFGPPPAPVRTLPPDLDRVRTTLYRSRLTHRYADIPRLIVERTLTICHDAFPGWRAVILPFLVCAIFLGRGELRFAAIAAAIDFLAYLTLSHPAHLTKYYMEIYPALFFLASQGLWGLLVGPIGGRESLEPPPPEERPVAAAAGICLIALLLVPAFQGLRRSRFEQMAETEPKAQFLRKIQAISSKRAVVFVRYGPAHLSYRSLIENDADLDHEHVWLAYDRGADNARLRAISPDRIPFLYLEGPGSLIRLDLPLTAEEEGLVGTSGATLTSPRAESRSVLPDS